MRSRTNRQRTSTSLFHVFYIGCHKKACLLACILHYEISRSLSVLSLFLVYWHVFDYYFNFKSLKSLKARWFVYRTELDFAVGEFENLFPQIDRLQFLLRLRSLFISVCHILGYWYVCVCAWVWVFYKLMCTCVFSSITVACFLSFLTFQLLFEQAHMFPPPLVILITLPQISSDNTFNFLFIRCYLSASASKCIETGSSIISCLDSPSFPPQQIFSSQLVLIRQLTSSFCFLYIFSYLDRFFKLVLHPHY